MPNRAVLVLVAAKLVLSLAYANGYGYFRDELYYLACARRLAWGYVDHPPFSVAVLAVERAVLGESLFAIRFVPALAGALLVWLTAWIARELGGGRSAQILAALAALVCPVYIGLSHFYSMNVFELVFWAAATVIVARIFTADAPARRLWILLGVVLGLGLLNKLSVLWFVGGVFVGIVATRHRRLLSTPGPWITIAIASLLFAPHIAWQVSHDWPTREFVRAATEQKMVATPPLAFLAKQVLEMHPLTALLWIPGLGALLFWKPLERFRPLGIAYLAILALLLVNQKSRSGYLAPAYPMLFAAGGVLAERATRSRRWIAAAYGGLLAAGGAMTAPFALPILPVRTFIAYAAALGMTPSTEEKKEVGPLPQFFADMHGWPELAEAVARAASTLSPEERADAVIFAGNYGEAGALEFFGPRLGLPPVICGHNNYWMWGAHGATGRVVIVMDDDGSGLSERYESVEHVATFEHPLVMPYENHLKIFVCRNRRAPIAPSWAAMKHYD